MESKSVKSESLREMDDPLDEAIYRLRRLSRQMRNVGMLMALLTAFNLGSALVLPSLVPLVLSPSSRVYSELNSQLILVSTLLVLLAIGLALSFEGIRRQADVLFKEISDELQWHVRFDSSVEASAETAIRRSRPDIGVRLALRSYAQSSGLPLAPGQYGPLIYIILNFGFLAIGLLLLKLGTPQSPRF